MKNISALVLGILLLSLGFFVGSSWRTTENDSNDSNNTAISNTTSTTNTTTKSIPTPAIDPKLNTAEKATIRLFEEAAPAVTFITTTNIRRSRFSMNTAEIPRGTGSGFIWDKSGHIITNYHVIQGADRAQVTLADRSTWQATLVGAAPEKDLAVLKIDAPADQLIPIPIGDSEILQVGQSVYAIGNPFGLDQTLTTGIISALGREIESVDGVPIRGAIQTDAAINPGNSGGPLLNSSGALIGVNTAIYSPSGAYAGIGFSIPVDVLKWVIPDLLTYGRINRPALGIELAPNRITSRLGIQNGILVLQTTPNGAAEKAGIQATYRNKYGEIILGDIITAINGDPVKERSDLILVLEQYKIGDQVEVSLIRNQKHFKTKLVLMAME